MGTGHAADALHELCAMSDLTPFQRRVLESIRDHGRLPPDIRVVASRRASINEMLRRGWFERWEFPGRIEIRLTAKGKALL
jgi:hypothetical protein